MKQQVSLPKTIIAPKKFPCEKFNWSAKGTRTPGLERNERPKPPSSYQVTRDKPLCAIHNPLRHLSSGSRGNFEGGIPVAWILWICKLNKSPVFKENMFGKTTSSPMKHADPLFFFWILPVFRGNVWVLGRVGLQFEYPCPGLAKFNPMGFTPFPNFPSLHLALYNGVSPLSSVTLGSCRKSFPWQVGWRDSAPTMAVSVHFSPCFF